jgi:hypothetical protein
MLNTPSISKCCYLLTVNLIFCCHIYGQECEFFKEYPNVVKTSCANFIDSLKQSGIDTILFYGVGIGESGTLAYGKIIWTTQVRIRSAEITRGEYNEARRKFSVNPVIYDTLADRRLIQYYLDNRLDTVKSDPRELHWMSHDFLHYVYASVGGTSTCFVAPNYLLRDVEHPRAVWAILLNLSLDDSQKPYKLYYKVESGN